MPSNDNSAYNIKAPMGLPADQRNTPKYKAAWASAESAGLPLGSQDFYDYVSGLMGDGTSTDIQPTAGPGTGAAVDPTAQAIHALYQHWQGSNNNALNGQLDTITAQAQQTGANALDQLRATLGGQHNPYANQTAQPVVATNPMAEYMKASGVATTGVDALQQLLASTAQQSQQAGQAYQNNVSQSWDANQQGRMQDAATSGAAFQQALANNHAAYQTQLATTQQKTKDDLMLQILQMAISGGADLNKLGVKF